MGQNLTLTAADGFELGAYRADPEGAPKGGIVVIQEIFGVNGHIREVADGYAAAGFVAIAPALYDRVSPGVELGYEQADIQAGLDIRAKCELDNVLADITAAAGLARTAGGGKVGAVGFCWGGFLAAASAINLAGTVDACVGYYGGGIANSLLDQSPRVPLLSALRRARPRHPARRRRQGARRLARRAGTRLRRGRSRVRMRPAGQLSRPLGAPGAEPDAAVLHQPRGLNPSGQRGSRPCTPAGRLTTCR